MKNISVFARFSISLISAFALLASTAQAQSLMFGEDANKDFQTEIQPKLLEQAADPATSVYDYMMVTKRLGIYGDASAAPVVALELANPAKSFYARNALEEMPFPEALAELRAAAEFVTDPVCKAGIFDSLGMRRDTEAKELLLEYADSEDPVLADAALFALARIADPSYKDRMAAELTGYRPEKGADLNLMYGDFLRRDGNEADAVDVFHAILENAPVPFYREAAAYQILLNETDVSREEASAWLIGDDDAKYRGTVRAAQYVHSSGVCSTLVRAFADVPAERKAALAAALTAYAEPEARNVVTEALNSDDAAVQEAVLNAFQSASDRDAILKLAETAIGGSDELRSKAMGVLTRLDAADADDVFIGLLDGDEPSQIFGAGVVGARKIEAGRDKLLNLASSGTPAVQSAAMAALGAVADLNLFQFLADTYAENGNEAAIQGLKRACGAVPDKDAAAAVLEKAAAKADGKDRRLQLFLAFADLGGTAALRAVEQAAFSNDNDQRDWATRTLGAWMSPDAADTLLKLAETPRYPYANRALRGALRLAKQFAMEDEARANILKRAEASPACTDKERDLIKVIRDQYKME